MGLRALGAVAVAILLVGAGASCVVEEDTGERNRFEDDTTSSGPTGGGAGGFMTTVTTAAGAAGGGGAGGSSSITTGGGAGGPDCDYDSPNTCLSADTVTEIAGDTGTDIRVIRGTTSRFVKVFVAEEVSSAFSFPDLRFVARLDNSPGMDFDLTVYVGDAQPVCNGESTTASNEPAVVAGAWNDDLNSDDGSWMVFGVHHMGGDACGSDAEWTLTIAGNHAINCDYNGTCGGDDDCTCSDCDGSSSCGSCNNDGTCDADDEGCGCSDCSGTPACL